MTNDDVVVAGMAVHYDMAQRESALLITPDGLRWAIGTADAVIIPWESIRSASIGEAESRRTSEDRAYAMAAFAVILTPLAFLGIPFLKKKVVVEQLVLTTDTGRHVFESVKPKSPTRAITANLVAAFASRGVPLERAS